MAWRSCENTMPRNLVSNAMFIYCEIRFGLRQMEIPSSFYGTTPSGRSKQYSYYMSQAKLNGKKIHIPCNVIEEQIPEWLQGIIVNSDLVPTIQKMYRTQVQQVTDGDREEKSGEINQRLAKLREEEAHLGRLLITGKISEESFDRLRVEWQEKIRYVHSKLDDLERKSSVHLDQSGFSDCLDASYVPIIRAVEEERTLDTLAGFSKAHYS